VGASGLNRRAVLAAGLALVAAPAFALDDIASADTVLTAPDGREVPVRVTWPRGDKRRLPLLILSHGANGTLNGLTLLQRSLTRARVVIAPRHPDSEENPQLASVDRTKVFGQRVADMKLILDQLPALERLCGVRVDRRRIAAGGHSFGALIAQALGGAQVGAPVQDWRDPRVMRVVAFSPPGRIPNYANAAGWAAMAVPQFVQTGTADVVPMIAPTWEAHLESFGAANVAGSVLWVGEGVDHYFGNRIQRLARVAPDQGAAFRLATDLADSFIAGRRVVAPVGSPTARFTTK
jgi:dienelactone hydrolase